ncbi:MAG TPA: hypothetical protein VNT26_13125, partial [Candidatus Sulfotelmatobacter sp.]|nr:hypothetical protein [Candidatus Sulfotelmatobacter sp.]
MPKAKGSPQPVARQPKAGTPAPGPPGPQPSRSGRRRWLFRLGALLVVPLLVLAALEGSLRLAG